jgi:hypothetical protein
VIAARRDGKVDNPAETLRYLSKNNLNIARLAAPPEPLRRGTILIPFRDPVQQAASMLRQHERFLEIHEEDDFVREYMEAIGHHEFGKGLKPIDFNGWLDDSSSDPEDLEFWVRYWTETYRFVLEQAGEEVTFVSYARLTEEPGSALSDLVEAGELPAEDLVPLAGELHAPRTHSVDRARLPEPLLREAKKTYESLDRRTAV